MWIKKNMQSKNILFKSGTYLNWINKLVSDRCLSVNISVNWYKLQLATDWYKSLECMWHCHTKLVTSL